MEHESDSMAMPQSPSPAPLQQMSQDRFNTIRSPLSHTNTHTHIHTTPQSPSIPSHLQENESPSRRSSEIGVNADIRSKIAFFSSQNGNTSTNSFAMGSPTRSPLKSAPNSPLKHSRASSVVSIPTHPNEVTALVQTLSLQLEQSRARERLVAERVESMMEQLQNAHTRARQEQQYSDKELKSMKKQVHKAELALIRCQADLEESRKDAEGFKVRAEHERLAKEKSRDEAFERARTLASNLEELEFVKKERDLLLSENETLKSIQTSQLEMSQSRRTTFDAAVQINLDQKPEVRMYDAAVQIDLNARQTTHTTMTDVAVQNETVQETPSLSVVPACQKCLEMDTMVQTSNETDAIRDIQEELDWVKSQLAREQDLVHFMNMQCQFRACPCRMAEKNGVRFVHDHVYEQRQDTMAKAKGIKRKAEDELPLPKYTTLRESFDQKSRERHDSQSGQKLPLPEPQLEAQPLVPQQAKDELDCEPEDAEDEEPTLRAMPSASTTVNTTITTTSTETFASGSNPTDNVAGVIALEEAAFIPLPDPKSDDSEPTALLEDMTQVMIEPESAATAAHFAFSTSTSRRPRLPASLTDIQTPKLQSPITIPVSASGTDDLFDIRPPRNLPPRPSTVMGVRTIGSPIRMVPVSPEHRKSVTPTISPQHKTIQVPLKDSPVKNSITQRRSQSRPRSRIARSPTPGRANPDSPAAETYFPVTPKQKAERPARMKLSAYPQPELPAIHSTTTTKIPLKSEDDLELHSEPVERGRQPLYESDPNKNKFSKSTSSMFPGTPISREAALEQIRARRDRARSVAMRKAEDESKNAKTPKSVARRGVMVGMGRDVSNLSQASAPARF